MTRIHTRDLRPGDVVDYHGHPHRVSHVNRRAGWAWPVAFDDAGWAVALGNAVVVLSQAACRPGRPRTLLTFLRAP